MAFPAHLVAVLLIAHGSRHAAANDDLFAFAERLAGRGDHAIVEASFLELAEPDIRTGGARCVAGARRVCSMVPYFLSAGVHLIRDLTAAARRAGRPPPGRDLPARRPPGPHPLLDAPRRRATASST